MSIAVIRARGYSYHRLPAWLHDQGFSHAVGSARVPGLVIPVRDVHGEIRFYQYSRTAPGSLGRQATPSTRWPYGARLAVDVPPPALPAS